MTKSFATIQPVVKFTRNGQIRDESVRVLRVLPGGAGFGVVKRGKVLPVVPVGDGRVALCDLNAEVRLPKADCPVAKMADLGLPTKAAAKATAKSLGLTPERTPAQRAATVRMLAAGLAKAIASGDADRIAKAQAALAKAQANLEQAQASAKPTRNGKAAKLAGKNAIPAEDVDALAAALKASKVDLVELIQKLAQ